MPPRHDHYHEIAAQTHQELGLATGRAFGTALHPFLGRQSDVPVKMRVYLEDCMALTRQHFPDYVAEIEGYAAGAGADLMQLWQMMLEDDLSALPMAKPRPGAEKCTSFVTNHARLMGHNEDWDEEAQQRLFILRRVLYGRTTLELHYAGTLGGNAVSINDAGMIQMINSLPCEPVDTTIPRVPTNLIARHLSDCEDITQGFDYIRGLPRMGGYAHTLINVRPDGKHVMAELSQNDQSITDITAYPAVHANHFVLEGMEKYNRDRGKRTLSSHQRYETACTGTSENMTAEEAMTLLEDTGNGPDFSLLNKRTIAGVVIDLEDACAWIRLSGEADKGWLRYELDFLP